MFANVDMLTSAVAEAPGIVTLLLHAVSIQIQRYLLNLKIHSQLMNKENEQSELGVNPKKNFFLKITPKRYPVEKEFINN